MRYLVTSLIVALIVAGFWGADSRASAQDDCISAGAVPAGETALAADCEVLLAVRDILLGTATLERAADTRIEEWDEFRFSLEEAAIAAGPPFHDLDEIRLAVGEEASENVAAERQVEPKHYYVGPPSLNWAADVPIEDWEGITVDETPRRVVRIDLERERLPGTIPEELGDLSGLEWLHLRGNELSGPVPSELGSLSSLTSLQLDWNRLSGPIPAELGDLSNLTELYLDRNLLTGEIPHSFTNLTNLTDFRFSVNEGLCAPTYEAFREWLGAVEYIVGSACDFAADRAVLVKFFDSADGPNWRRNHGWVSKQPMGEWYGVYTDGEGRVTQLDLRANRLRGQIPAELGDLSNLYRLHLYDNQLSGPLPSELVDLSNLKGLILSKNQLTGPVPSELGDLSKLNSLSLGDNQLSGEIPQDLGRLLRLDYLNLRGNQLSGEIPSELGDLSRLERLDLDGNQLSGQIPSVLGDLSYLEVLNLDGNQLSGQIPPELGGLSRLNSLDLGNNQLSGELPPELGNLSRLGSLHLSENQLTGGVSRESYEATAATPGLLR